MKTDLDTLKTEILDYLEKEGFIVFHGCSRRLEEGKTVDWDTHRYPDYQRFLGIARQLGVKVVVFHHREFTAGHVDHALDQLEEAELDAEDRQRIEREIRSLASYEALTSTIEISYEYEERLYFFELRAEWYQEYESLMDEIDASTPEEGDEDDEDAPMGGYYSRN
jgi:hypothetical protein